MKNIKEQLKSIATLRETKGKENETLEKIKDLIPQVKKSKLWKELATLYWETHLVWQHKAMQELDKLENKATETVLESAEKMMEYAQKAKEVIDEYDLEDMRGGAYRFLGRAATYMGDHEKAKEYYEEAISKYYGKNEKSKLEVGAFLAEATVRLGNGQEGLEKAKQIFDDFYNSDLGRQIKQEDYFVWAVWMSGVMPRVVKALVETDQDFDRKEAAELLKKTKEELENPSEKITWGDDKFEFRIDEINAALKKLD